MVGRVTGSPAFELRNVTYRYEAPNGAVPPAALTEVSLSIERGERVALLGANGSGKSTLLRLLDGLYFAQSGEIAFDGRKLEPSALDDDAFAFDFRRRVGLVFQDADVQLFNPTVLDEVAFGPLQLRWPPERVLERVEETLRVMEIAHLRGRPPHRLSGGEKKRVALASVLVLEPEILLLDEPTAGLDPRSESQIIDLLIGWGQGARTVITATHDLGLVEDIAGRAVILEGGRVTADGDPAALLRDTALLARANLLHAHRNRHAGGLSHTHPHGHGQE